MSFWILVRVKASGEVATTTYNSNIAGMPLDPIRTRTGATVSQALRSLASSLVYATAETVAQKDSPK